MFRLPLIAFPFLLALAAYRLHRLPRQYLTGALKPAHPGIRLRSGLTVLVYGGFFGYSVWLALLVAQTALDAPCALSGRFSLAPAVGGYPIAYTAAEWAFHHGFERTKGGANEQPVCRHAFVPPSASHRD
jgi:hypothetical protein